MTSALQPLVRLPPARFPREAVAERVFTGVGTALDRGVLRAMQLVVERALIVAGRGDRIVPPEHPAALSTHWGGAAIHWFSGSHLAPFGRARVIRRIDRHLRSIGIL